MRTNWGGNLQYRASGLLRASTVAEVQQIVAESDAIRVLGSRHSFSDIADTDGLHLSLEGLTGIESLDPARQRAKVGGGTRYSDLADALHERGFALANLASLPHITVAGAVVTATHGSGSLIGNLATAVSAMEIVTASGDILRLSRGADDSIFEGAVVNLGALGAIVSITLDVEPAYSVRQTVYTGLSHQVLEEEFDAAMAVGTSVSIFTDWRGDTAQAVWVKDRLLPSGSGAPPDVFGAPAALRPMHPLPGGPAENCTEQLGKAGPWHERLPHFRPQVRPSNGEEIQAEYFLPRHQARRAIAAMRRHGESLAPVLLVSEVRTVAADRLWLSPSQGEPYFGLHFTFKCDWERVRAVLPLLEADLGPLGAIPHWGKVSTMPPALIAARMPRMAEFKELLVRYDPSGKFRNRYIRRLFPGL